MAANTIGNLIFIVFTLFGWAIFHWDERSRNAKSFWESFGWCVWFIFCAVSNVVHAHTRMDWALIVVQTATAGYLAHSAWKKRPPRQRKPSKVAGQVLEALHRRGLIVVPE